MSEPIVTGEEAAARLREIIDQPGWRAGARWPFMIRDVAALLAAYDELRDANSQTGSSE